MLSGHNCVIVEMWRESRNATAEALHGDGDAAAPLTGAATRITHEVHSMLFLAGADLCVGLEKVLACWNCCWNKYRET